MGKDGETDFPHWVGMGYEKRLHRCIRLLLLENFNELLE